MSLITRTRQSDYTAPAAKGGGAEPGHVAMYDLYKRLHRKARAFAVTEIGFVAADDVVHQAMLEVLEVCYHGPDIPDQPVDTLFWRILRHRCIDWQRQQYEHVEIREPQSGEVVPATPYADNRANPALVADGSMLAARVDYLIESFPPEMRKVMRAAREHDWQGRAIADAIGMKYELVKWHLKEGRERLRKQLEKDGYSVPGQLKIGRPAGRGRASAS